MIKKPKILRDEEMMEYANEDANQSKGIERGLILNGARVIAQAQNDYCYRETLKQFVKDIGQNCYLVWAEVDGQYKENICIDKEWIKALQGLEEG